MKQLIKVLLIPFHKLSWFKSSFLISPCFSVPKFKFKQNFFTLLHKGWNQEYISYSKYKCWAQWFGTDWNCYHFETMQGPKSGETNLLERDRERGKIS